MSKSVSSMSLSLGFTIQLFELFEGLLTTLQDIKKHSDM